MSAQDRQDAKETIEAIGKLLNHFSTLGFPDLHESLARGVRQSRGLLGRQVYPVEHARHLLGLKDDLEKLIRRLTPEPDPDHLLDSEVAGKNEIRRLGIKTITVRGVEVHPECRTDEEVMLTVTFNHEAGPGLCPRCKRPLKESRS